MDTLTTAQRSERMANIKSKDTQPELLVRRLAHQLGYRFRLHRADLPGKPDLVFPGRQRVILVHGCFWHAHKNCKVANRPKSNTPFWDAKFKYNRQRDARNVKALTGLGWKVLTIWECEVPGKANLARRLLKFLGSAPALDNMRRRSNGRH